MSDDAPITFHLSIEKAVAIQNNWLLESFAINHIANIKIWSIGDPIKKLGNVTKADSRYYSTKPIFPIA
ncbi:hypothetical protein FEQ05_03418 [Burkholderia pseudomultivorans]|uniref:Uncharacterized protein n=1 Tax=Burkholderia pseudomultivorans TaxID=1207504 RepID=A0A132E777_9BURK|nr:hypothetical protein WT56_29855 [Burkholderia pseudomultivorans]MDR8729195.1 hypothetical protein [Burkholderia pseudomultivorans]MDR8737759.1 hypothetical protein [Burkholderia pseudomultivorans]MDR8743967.1 hypothetical protein [Burkholderia pseudomultivorans]MDR8755292.1 hypothetical protein [Burkholderia pseudomultivorans]